MKNYLKVLSLTLVLIMTLSILFIIPIAGADDSLYEIDGTPWDGSTIATAFAYGDGKEKSPFVIASAAQFAYFRNSVNASDFLPGKYFILACDIDLGGNVWSPIGTSESVSFNGIFDGCGYTISNYKINATTTNSRQGLFSYLTLTNTVIQNLHIANAQITSTSSGSYVGALVGYIKGAALIQGIIVESDVTVTGIVGSSGGIAGRIISNGVAQYCINNANVSGSAAEKNVFVGGICGVVGLNATIEYCINNGVMTVERAQGVSETAFYAGGISGLMGASSVGGTIKNCYNTGAVSCSVVAGGVSGYINTEGNTIENSYNLSENISGLQTHSGSILGCINKISTFNSNKGVSINELGMYGTIFNPAQSDFSGLVQDSAVAIQTYTDAIDSKIDEIIIQLNAIDYTPDPSVTDEVTTEPVTTQTDKPVTTTAVTTKAITTSSTGTTTQTNSTTKATDSGCNCGSSSILITLVSIIGSVFLFASPKIAKH